MSNVDDVTLSKINSGKQAKFTKNLLAPLLSKRALATINELKSNFRSGNFDSLTAQCLVAKLVSFDEIDAEINALVNIGLEAERRVEEKA